MRLALGFNPIMSASEAALVSKKAEALEYDSVWLHESLFQRDVVTCLAAMAGATQRIKVGSGVINTFTRHPVTAATTFATLSELSGGRVVMGLGVGSFPTIPLIGHRIFPTNETRPLKRIREYIEVVRRVWGGEKVEFDGEFFKVHNLTLGFKVKERVPIFIATLSPKTQAYAPTAADGVILSPAFSTPDGVSAMIQNVRKGESRAKKDVERASYMIASIDPDPQRARNAVRDYYFFAYQLAEVVKPETLSSYGVAPDDLAPMKEAWKKGDVPGAKKLIPEGAIEALSISGGEEDAREKIGAHLKAGVTLPILMPIGNVEYTMERLSPSNWGG